MSFDPQSLSDEDFFYACIVDYDADQLSGKQKERMDGLMKDSKFADLAKKFHNDLGSLQLQLQGYYLGSQRMNELYDMVESADVRKTHEMQKIEKAGRSEMLSNIRRRLTIAIIVVLGAFSVVYFTTSRKSVTPFEPLSFISQEAAVLLEETDRPMDYNLLQTDSEGDVEANMVDADRAVSELDTFFESHPDLDFVVTAVTPPSDWVPVGATIIEYDTAVAAVVRYRQVSGAGQDLLLFSYRGQVTDLPKTDTGILKDNGRFLNYQAYGSDRMNLVAFQRSEDVVGMVVGVLSVVDLAKFAYGIR